MATGLAASVPAGEIVEIVASPGEGSRTIDVLWSGKRVMMFASDLEERSLAVERDERHKTKSLLIVEDNPKDMLVASSVAQAIGVSNVQGTNSLAGALSILEGGLKGEVPLPDAILLDLDLGLDSGYEVLRLWRTTPEMNKVRVIVWSILSDDHKQMCDVFRVTCFMGKWEGQVALRESLVKCLDLESA